MSNYAIINAWNIESGFVRQFQLTCQWKQLLQQKVCLVLMWVSGVLSPVCHRPRAYYPVWSNQSYPAGDYLATARRLTKTPLFVYLWFTGSRRVYSAVEITVPDPQQDVRVRHLSTLHQHHHCCWEHAWRRCFSTAAYNSDFSDTLCLVFLSRWRQGGEI